MTENPDLVDLSSLTFQNDKNFRHTCIQLVGFCRLLWLPAFSPFPTMISVLSKTNFYFSVTFLLLSAKF